MSDINKYGKNGTITVSSDGIDGAEAGSLFRWNAVSESIVPEIPSKDDFDLLADNFRVFKNEMYGRLTAIEEQMAIVRRDTVLEKDFEELKEAWEAYNNLLEKLKTFKALQDSA